LDTAENDREKINEAEKEKLRLLFVPDNPHMMEIERKQAIEIYQQTVDRIDKFMNYGELPPNLKSDLSFFKINLLANHTVILSLLSIAEFASNLSQVNQKALLYVADIASKNNSSANEKIIQLQTVLEEKKVAEIARIMGKMEKEMEERKEANNKASEAYRV
jgi:hypothetical protein